MVIGLLQHNFARNACPFWMQKYSGCASLAIPVQLQLRTSHDWWLLCAVSGVYWDAFVFAAYRCAQDQQFCKRAESALTQFYGSVFWQQRWQWLVWCGCYSDIVVSDHYCCQTCSITRSTVLDLQRHYLCPPYSMCKLQSVRMARRKYVLLSLRNLILRCRCQARWAVVDRITFKTISDLRVLSSDQNCSIANNLCLLNKIEWSSAPYCYIHVFDCVSENVSSKFKIEVWQFLAQISNMRQCNEILVWASPNDMQCSDPNLQLCKLWQCGELENLLHNF